MTTRLVGLALCLLSPLALALTLRDEPNAAPATSQAAILPITVTGVEGNVQVRDGADKPWRHAAVGMTVTEGAEFRTGPHSAVRVLIPPDQTITLDRLGVIKLMQVLRQGDTIKTRVGMPFGRTRYDIEEAGLEHQSELVSPSSTLAIRGTKVSIYDQPPFAPSAVSLTGRATYRTAKRQIALGNKGQGKTQVSADTDNPAEFALVQTYVDPNPYGRPPADQKLIRQLQSKGDIVLNHGQLAIATGPAVTDKQLQDIIAGQGRFNISLRWTGPGDFDLFVLTPNPVPGQPAYTLGNPSYKGSVFKDIGLFGQGNAQTLSKTPDGGQIKFDQIALGGGGLELASWNTPVPQVGYNIAVLYYDHRGQIKNYPLRSNFRVDAFLDGKPVNMLLNFDDVLTGKATNGLEFGPVFTGTGTLVESEQVIRPVPGADVPGNVHVTAIDLTESAVGPINGQDQATTAAAKRSARSTRGFWPKLPTVTPTGRVMGPVLPTAAKGR
ncbi:MAG TPA: hypothetical protein VH475_22005 [Tepidisphaeraceae bacterium]